VNNPHLNDMAAQLKEPQAPGILARLGFTPPAWIGCFIVSFWLFIALFGPSLAPHLESDIITDVSYAPAGEVGLLGSDYLGRDVLSRLLYGARMTMGLAFMATILSFSIGITLGFIAASSGRWIDGFMSRVNDALMAFPSVILALIVMSALGTSLTIMVVTVAIIDSTRVFRLSRALATDVSVMDFVDVARARGESLWWITVREILPNTLAPLTAEFGIRFTFAILFISALSFLGLGVQPPTADWGVMVKENLQGLLFGSAAALMPAGAVASLTVGVNLIVDWFLTRIGGGIAEEMLE
jgi:peptide/nickel transport system permease protein